MESFASDTCNGSPNDKIAMNMDMVKPIPANNPTPIICLHVLPSGKLLSFNLVQMKEVKRMPTGFPNNKPRLIPSPREFVNPLNISFSKVIFVLANAKSGIIKRLTGLVSACSKRSNGDSTSVSFVGIHIATSTPAMVA